jgi:hypothetical protein
VVKPAGSAGEAQPQLRDACQDRHDAPGHVRQEAHTARPQIVIGDGVVGAVKRQLLGNEPERRPGDDRQHQRQPGAPAAPREFLLPNDHSPSP